MGQLKNGFVMKAAADLASPAGIERWRLAVEAINVPAGAAYWRRQQRRRCRQAAPKKKKKKKKKTRLILCYPKCGVLYMVDLMLSDLHLEDSASIANLGLSPNIFFLPVKYLLNRIFLVSCLPLPL